MGRQRIINHETARADTFRRPMRIELANEARREDDYGWRRFLIDKARALVNNAPAAFIHRCQPIIAKQACLAHRNEIETARDFGSWNVVNHVQDRFTQHAASR